MGQLEKYGLYVLCLVIFLILGVTIWGGGDLPPTAKRTAHAPIVAPGGGAPGGAGSLPGKAATSGGSGDAARGDPPRGDAARSDPLGGAKNLDALFGPSPRGAETKKPEAKPADASGKPEPALDNAGKPTKPPEKSAGPRKTYRVKNRDTLEGIAKEQLGNPSLHPLISQLNPKIEATRLQVGDELQLPTAAEITLLSARPAAADKARVEGRVLEGQAKDAGGTYRVKKGDTLEGIAGAQLGSAKRVNELRELNPSVEPTKLRIGMTIRLPK